MVRQVKNGQADEKSPYASCSEYVSIDAGKVWKLEVPYWRLKLEIAICDIKRSQGSGRSAFLLRKERQNPEGEKSALGAKNLDQQEPRSASQTSPGFGLIDNVERIMVG